MFKCANKQKALPGSCLMNGRAGSELWLIAYCRKWHTWRWFKVLEKFIEEVRGRRKATEMTDRFVKSVTAWPSRKGDVTATAVTKTEPRPTNPQIYRPTRQTPLPKPQTPPQRTPYPQTPRKRMTDLHSRSHRQRQTSRVDRSGVFKG